MKKTLTLLLCILYTFVTFGGSLFVHYCDDNVMMSIYDKSSHDDCPICAQHMHQEFEDCQHGTCNDVEIKIDQLKDTFFSSTKADKFLLQPMVVDRLWLDLVTFSDKQISKVPIPDLHLYYTNSSPPVYILNCNLRN